MKHLYRVLSLWLLVVLGIATANAADWYLVGTNYNNWNDSDTYGLTANDNGSYSITVSSLSGEWKIKEAGNSWDTSFGVTDSTQPSSNAFYQATKNSSTNFTYSGSNVTITIFPDCYHMYISTSGYIPTECPGGHSSSGGSTLQFYGAISGGEWGNQTLVDNACTFTNASGKTTYFTFNYGDGWTGAWRPTGNTDTEITANGNFTAGGTVGADKSGCYKITEEGTFTVTVTDETAKTFTVSGFGGSDPDPDPTPSTTYYLWNNLNSGSSWTSTAMTNNTIDINVSSTSYFVIHTVAEYNSNSWSGCWRPNSSSDYEITSNGTYYGNGSSDKSFKITTAGKYTIAIADASAKSFTVSGFGGSDPDPDPDPDTYVIYFDNSDGWASPAPKVYAWDSSNNALAGEWPGTAMTLVSGSNTLYTYTFTTAPAGLIITDGKGDSDSNKLGGGDLTFVNGKTYSYATDGGGSSDWEEEEGEVEGDYVIYFNNYDGWATTPYVWAWNGSDNFYSSWPGEAMTLVPGCSYKYYKTFTKAPSGIIITDGKSTNPGDDNKLGGGDLTFYNKKVYSSRSYTEPVTISKTLPVLYINIYTDETYTTLDNAVLDKDLADKNYRPGNYWLDCQYCSDDYLAFVGLKSAAKGDLGTEAEPLPLTMKARGNYTRTGFSKKPFKLKLDSKQNMLGLNKNGKKSKHWAILTHADDSFGYLRNFVGFNLGEKMGLPWTPRMAPVEVVINGDYRGIYSLTESIRVGDGRIDIEELEDDETNNRYNSGGYLVELDNYFDDGLTIQINNSNNGNDLVWVTPDTPEEYSTDQKSFVTSQFTTMHSLVKSRSTDLWSYMELDDAARYYIVEEIIGHWEAYHGSTYLFRDFGNGQKWHFSPLWDCGNAFNSNVTSHFYDCDQFGNTWITDLVNMTSFMDKVKPTFRWFMQYCYGDLKTEMTNYVNLMTTAVNNDAQRWSNAALPASVGGNNPSAVVNNTDILTDLETVISYLDTRLNWLKGQWGSWSESDTEPERDLTAAAELPRMFNPDYYTTIYFQDRTTELEWASKDVYCYAVDNAGYKPLSAFPGTKMDVLSDPTNTAAASKARRAPGKEDLATYKTWTITVYEAQDYDTSNVPIKVVFSDGTNDMRTDGVDLADDRIYYATDNGLTTGVESVIYGTDADAPVEYFDLMGRRVTRPVSGQIYIRRQGAAASKIRF